MVLWRWGFLAPVHELTGGFQMTQNEMTKVRLTLGSLQLEYEGREEFLTSEVPTLVGEIEKLHASSLIGPFSALQVAIERSVITHREIAELTLSIKNDLDSMSEMGEMESLRLQMAMDRLSKMMSTLSNLLKKISDTANAITTNLK
jgi:methyl-accepting chemotaxis protein